MDERRTTTLWRSRASRSSPWHRRSTRPAKRFAGPIGAGYRHRLVWSFGFQRKGDDGQWEVLVDAQTGEVLSFEDRNLYEKKKVTGGVYPLTGHGSLPIERPLRSDVPRLPDAVGGHGLGLSEQLHEQLRDSSTTPAGPRRPTFPASTSPSRITAARSTSRPWGTSSLGLERPARLHDRGLLGGDTAGVAVGVLRGQQAEGNGARLASGQHVAPGVSS